MEIGHQTGGRSAISFPAILVVCSIALAGCGGGPTPTSPSPAGVPGSPVAPLAPPTGLSGSITRTGVTNVLRLSWTGSNLATAHVVEIGTASMGSDILQREVAADVIDTQVSAGRLFARVK